MSEFRKFILTRGQNGVNYQKPIFLNNSKLPKRGQNGDSWWQFVAVYGGLWAKKNPPFWGRF